MRNLSLKIRMMSYSTAMILLGASAISVALLYFHQEYVWEEFELRTASITRSLAKDMELSLLLEDKEAIRSKLETLMEFKDVLSTSVFDKNNVLLVKAGEDSSISKEFVRVISLEVQINPLDIHEEMSDAVDVTVPEKIGRVTIVFSTLKLKSGLRKMITIAIFITLIFTVLRIVSDYFFTKGITKPLANLVDGSHAVAGGNLDQTIEVPASSNELGMLASSFNKMVTALKNRDEEIKDHHQKLEKSYTKLESSHKELDHAYDKLGEKTKELEEYKTFLEDKVKERTMDIEEANRRLVEAFNKIKEVDRLKSEFLANMSHELRTPLNSIIGFSKVILKGIDGPITDLQKNDLSAIHFSGQHLLGLINDILDLSKIESGKMEICHEDLDISELVTGVVGTLHPLLKEKDLEVTYKIEEGIPIVRADKTRIRQVFLNLISNAIKFTDKGWIQISIKKFKEKDFQAIENNPNSYCPKRSSVAEKENMLLISVEDSGGGIKEEDMPKVFETFRQIDNSSTKKEGGSGLGMAITHQMIEMHGGEMWLESVVQKGSIFHFFLPVKKVVIESREEEPPVVQIDKMNKGLVAVIDDEANAITLYRKMLIKEGYKVVGIQDPEIAMREVLSIKPDFIILDVLMPRKDGWELMEEFKKNPTTKHIPVIFSTIENNKNLGFSLGATDFLIKPVSEEELLLALNKLNGSLGKVLVIDDNLQDARLVTKILKDRGYEYFIAGGGKEGMEAIKEFKPDLIILDLMMPEFDGFTVVRAVKENPDTRDIPIIVLSGKDLTNEDRSKLNGHVETLLKKELYTEEELLNNIVATLKRVGN